MDHRSTDQPHPPWCDRQHVQTFDTHSREVGSVTLPTDHADEVTRLGVALYVDGDDPVQVWLTYDSGLATEVTQMSTDNARALGGYLVEAADRGDGLR